VLLGGKRKCHQFYFSRPKSIVAFTAKKWQLTRVAVMAKQVQAVIHVVRGNRMILDADLARLYGVTTAALNQAMKRNAARFSDDFAFQLSAHEFAGMMSQNVISKPA
jgi:hypothetical protein